MLCQPAISKRLRLIECRHVELFDFRPAALQLQLHANWVWVGSVAPPSKLASRALNHIECGGAAHDSAQAVAEFDKDNGILQFPAGIQGQPTLRCSVVQRGN